MSHSLYPIKLYIKDIPVAVMLLLSGVLHLSSWVWLLWQIRPQDEQIFLHYNILFGVNLIGEWYKVLYLPLLGLFIFAINALLSWILFRKDKVASHLLLFVSVVCQFFVLVGGAILVFLNV